MTEAEIMQALECCGDEEGLRWCTECPYYDKENDICQEDLHRDALDLINCKNAEVERLEALSKHHQTLINMLNEGIAEARAEAIKEFAERVKDKMFCEDFLLCEPCDMADILDQIAKEMGVSCERAKV